MHDSLVVGAGPAGSRFARQAALASHDVLAFEQGTVGKPLACSGHVSTDLWAFTPEGARRDNHTIATHPDAPDRVYVAAGDGYAESHDRGHTWQYPQAGLEHRYVWSVAVDPGDPDCVLVSAAAGARTAHDPARAESYVYRGRAGASDEGAWTLAMKGLDPADGLLRPVLAAGGEPGVLHALTNRGLFRTDDAGGAWARVQAGPASVYSGQVPRGLVVV